MPDSTEKAPSSIEKIRILVIDDQAMVVEAIRRLLADQSDMQVFSETNSLQAVSAALGARPDIILLDLVMPDVDGFQVVQSIRRQPTLVDVPVIVLSSKEDPRLKAQAFALGADDYMVKVPNKLELIARIRHHLACVPGEAEKQLRECQQQLHEARAALKKLPNIDADTSMPNREGFDLALEKNWQLAKASQKPLALLLCRISEYAAWQTASPDSSRLMLCKVAAALTLQLHNPGELIARFADDCFALLLPNMPLEAATQLANDARQKLDQLKLPAPHAPDRFISLAVGMAAVVAEAGTSADTLVKMASDALDPAAAATQPTAATASPDAAPAAQTETAAPAEATEAAEAPTAE